MGGSEACIVDELVKEGNLDSISKMTACGGGVEANNNKNVIVENGEQHHELSPVSHTSPDGTISETPKDTLFDSFAPGRNKLMLAPHHTKYCQESRIHVVRRLNFACDRHILSHQSRSMETISDDEEHLFEFVYATIMDAIVSEQTKQVCAKFPTLDGFVSPTKSPPHLSGVAETCPGAPVKSTGKYRNIGKEICKKLEF